MSLFVISGDDLDEIGRSNISASDIIKIQDRVRKSVVPTCDLVNELAKRKGVIEVVVPPHSGKVEIAAEDLDKPKPATESGYVSHYFFDEIYEGPARVLVVID